MNIGSIAAYGYGQSNPARDVGAASIARRSSLAIDTNGDRRPEVVYESTSGAAGVSTKRGRYSGVFGYDRNGVAVDGNSDGRKDARVENEVRFAARAGGYRPTSVGARTEYAAQSGNTRVEGSETNSVSFSRKTNGNGARTTALEARSQENVRVSDERGNVAVASTSRDRVAETVQRNGARSSEVSSARSLSVSGGGENESSSSVSSSVSVRGANAGRVSIAISQSVSNAYASVQQAGTASVRTS